METVRLRISALAAALTLALCCSACVGAGRARGPKNTLDLGVAPVVFFETGGAVVKAFIIGDPEAPRRLLFIHGWAGSGAEFIDLAVHLCVDRPDVLCICVDLPGSGSSDKPADAAYDAAYFRAVVTAAVEASSRYGLRAGAEPAEVTLAGHSLGGQFCADYAARGGRGIARLALISPAGWPGEVGALSAWASKNELALSLSPSFINEETYVIGHRMRSVYPGADFSEAAARYTARALATPEGRAALERVTRNSLEVNFIDEALRDIAVPVMLAWGRNDAVLPFPYSEKFLSRLPPGTRFEPLETCGHLPHTERVPEMAAILSGFIGTSP